jgi:uncharacterized protein
MAGKKVDPGKLESEAAEAGLVLLGPGKNCQTRTYRWLSCGHEAEYDTGKVRKGSIRCQTCLDQKLIDEATEAGLVLLGTGKDANYRSYRWQSCGHEAEYQIGAVRRGNVRCQVCLGQKLTDEASQAGLVLLGPGKDGSRRTYRWIKCGHEAEYEPGAVRNGRVRCQACLDQKLIDEATNAGLVLLGTGKSAHYRTYRWLSCGHEAEYQIFAVRTGAVRCQICLDQKLVDEADAAGLVLLGPGKVHTYRTYRWQACGHEAEYRLDHVRIGGVRCQTCLDQKLVDEATNAGLLLLGPGKRTGYRTYRWQSCGHEAECRPVQVRIGRISCQECDATAWSKPSNIYLLQFAADDGNIFLKLGVSNNIDNRIKTYGLIDSVKLVEHIVTIPTDTGKEATLLEKSLHTKLRKHRIHPDQMKDYLTISGHTECYPVTMRDEILKALSA